MQAQNNDLLVLKFSAEQLDGVKHQPEPKVAHFEQTQEGLGVAHLETEPVLFVFKTPVTEIQLSVTLNFDFRFVAAGSDEADYSPLSFIKKNSEIRGKSFGVAP